MVDAGGGGAHRMGVVEGSGRERKEFRERAVGQGKGAFGWVNGWWKHHHCDNKYWRGEGCMEKQDENGGEKVVENGRMVILGPPCHT